MAAIDTHSKLCLRRISPKSIQASLARHSPTCLREKSKKLKRGLQYIILSRIRSPRTENYFTQQLPAELRLLIYEHLLQFDHPLEVEQYHLRKQLHGISILRVCRLTYQEALPVLYKLNTIVTKRDEFCRFSPVRQPAFKPELVRNLYVGTLDSSITCAVRPWLSESEGYDEFEDTTCVNCEDSLFRFIKTLKSLPRLRKVCIDYHRHSHCVQTLWKRLSGPGSSRSHLYMKCVAVGKYRLQGPGVGSVHFELQDTLLFGWWEAVTHNVRDTGFIDGYRTRRRSFHALAAARRRHGYNFLTALDYVNHLATLFADHKVGHTPANFARIWPSDLPMDFRLISELRQSEFLHEFNMELQREMERYCYSNMQSGM